MTHLSPCLYYKVRYNYFTLLPQALLHVNRLNEMKLFILLISQYGPFLMVILFGWWYCTLKKSFNCFGRLNTFHRDYVWNRNLSFEVVSEILNISSFILLMFVVFFSEFCPIFNCPFPFPTAIVFKVVF